METDSVRLRLRPFFSLAGFLMAQRTDLAHGRDLVARWCVLAEQRLEYLTELFETGRWRRYHSEVAFLENIREAKDAVETWRGLLTREASLDNSRNRHFLARPQRRDHAATKRRARRARSFQPRPAEISAPLHATSIAAEPEPIVADEAPVTPETDALEQTLALTLDIVAMQERYPSLRNAL